MIKKADVDWKLTIMIPLEAFAYHDLHSLKDKTCMANFYKCGDELHESHYLAWNNITSTVPNFHLPQFFVEIHFV